MALALIWNPLSLKLGSLSWRKLHIGLFHQLTFVIPYLFNLINNRKVFKFSSAKAYFKYNEVSVSTVHAYGLGRTAFTFYVMCEPLDWQVDCAAQICYALIPTLSDVKELWLDLSYKERSGAINSATCCAA